MWIQWSLTRLVRWRVRDWASCFTACRFPLDDETDGYRSSPAPAPPQLPKIRNMVFDMKDESKSSRIGKKLLRRNRSNKNTCSRINLSSTVQAAADQNTSGNDSSWPHFADEDYIVFCFREDGAFDVVKDCKSEAAPNRVDCTSRSSWPVNQKLSHGDEAKTVNNSSHVERSNEEGYDICPTSDQRDINHVTEAEEEEVIYFDTESSSSRIRRRYQSDHNQEIENQGMVSMASSTDSNQSDNSTGSFAFPVLSWEWMGSPAQMPKSEGLHLRKHKTISLSFQCCRF